MPQRLARLDGPRRRHRAAARPRPRAGRARSSRWARRRRWAVGDRVTTPFVLACGTCASAARRRARCASGSRSRASPSGARSPSASRCRAPTPTWSRVPDAVDSDVAAGLGCRFATAYRALATSRGCFPVRPSSSTGAAASGWPRRWSPSRGAPRGGRRPVAESLAVAVGLGATTEPVGTADVSLDCFGSAATLAASIACLRPRGRHVQVGLLGGADARPAVDMGRLVGQELQLLGSHGMAASDYPSCSLSLADGTLDPGRLLRDRIGLEAAAERLAGLGGAWGRRRWCDRRTAWSVTWAGPFTPGCGIPGRGHSRFNQPCETRPPMPPLPPRPPSRRRPSSAETSARGTS